MKIVLTIFIFLMPFFVDAQDQVKCKEIGLSTRSLLFRDDFGFIYKTGSESALWRVNTLFAFGNHDEEASDIFEKVSMDNQITLNLGREYRKNFEEDFEFRYGFDLSFSFSHYLFTMDNPSTNEIEKSDKTISYGPGVNAVIGLNYKIKNKIIIGAEILPSFHYYTGKTESIDSNVNNGQVVISDLTGFSYGINNASVLFSISYRIKK